MTYRLGNFHDPDRSITRARRAYHYAQEGSESEPDAMDEQEQEELIKSLKQVNDEKNEVWIKYIFALTVCCFLPFLPSAMKSTALQPRILCLLSITSIFTTAYILVRVPTRKPLGGIASRSREPTELQKYLPYLDGVLCLLVGLNGLSWRNRTGAHDGFWILSWLPTVVLGMVIFAREALVEVDPDELWSLKYELKGA